MKTNQKGFSAVEIILVVAVVGLIGAVGWLVYDRQQGNTNAKTETSEPAKAAASNTSQKEDANNTPEDQAKYLVIKEWGVKLPQGDSASLSYVVKDTNTVSIRSAELDKVSANGCNTNSVTVVRGTANEVVPSSVDDPNNPTFMAVYNETTINDSDLSARSIKAKVGDYYYLAPGYLGASCVTNGVALGLASEATASINIVRSINQLSASR